MSRLLLLLLALLAAPAWAQDYVYVANQGDFSQGTGSVTRVNPYNDTDTVQLFENQLGSILQSATRIGDRLYLVGNSANRIEVVDTATNTRVGQFTTGLNGPRYIAPLAESVYDPTTTGAYVTNQVYSGASSYVLPLDLATGVAGTPIPVDGLPEGIVTTRTKAYVALGTFGPGNGGVDSVAVIDTDTDTLTRYIDIGCYARFVALTLDEGRVLAFCEDTAEGVVIDAGTDAVVQRFAFEEPIGDPFGIGQSVGPGAVLIAALQSAPASSTFYVVTASGVAEVGEDLSGLFGVLQTIPIPEADTRPISAVAFDTRAFALVLGRPDPDAPFSAAGTLTVHDFDGSLIETFPAGVYPAHIAVDERLPIATEGVEATDFRLALDGPNPAHNRTALALTLDRASDVRVDVLDVLGRPVARLADGPMGAGTHRLAVDASGWAAGTYLVRARTEAGVATLALTVAR